MNLKFLLLVFALLALKRGECKYKKKDLKKRLFLLNLPFASVKNKERNCSVARSSLVRKLLLEDFYPVFERYVVDVPKSCPFNLDHSMYHVLEENKNEQSTGSWKCEQCGKLFYKEEFVYKHIYRKHDYLINTRRKATCLAEYCDIFRCHLHEQYPIVRTDFPACNSKFVQELQRKCEKTVNKCLPSQMRHHVYDALTKSLCSELTCDSFYTAFEDMSLWTVLLLAIGIPSLIGISWAVCWKCFEHMTDDDSYESLLELEKRKQERMKRTNDATRAASRNRVGRYHSGMDLRRR